MNSSTDSHWHCSAHTQLQTALADSAANVTSDSKTQVEKAWPQAFHAQNYSVTLRKPVSFTLYRLWHVARSPDEMQMAQLISEFQLSLTSQNAHPCAATGMLRIPRQSKNPWDTICRSSTMSGGWSVRLGIPLSFIQHCISFFGEIQTTTAG